MNRTPRSFFARVRMADGSRILAVGKFYIQSSRCDTREMAEDLGWAIAGPGMVYEVFESDLAPQISMAGPVKN